MIKMKRLSRRMATPAETSNVKTGSTMAQEQQQQEPSLVVRFSSEGAYNRLSEAVAAALGDLTRVERRDDALELLAWESEVPGAQETQVVDETVLFVEDTTPDVRHSVPSYNRKFDTLNAKDADATEAADDGEKPPRANDCFNCSGNHLIRECPHPKNMDKINQRRREMRNKNVRYHAEEQVESDITPGNISRELRKALGLQKNQLPLHIYRMRMLGYPPGWLLNARVAHSGMAMFDSQGNEVKEENKCLYGTKDEYNIDKIVEFPGFNVPAGSKYIEECALLGYPPFNEDHSKMIMLERLAPIAMKAYRRRKLAKVKPECQPGDVPVEMDMDIEDEGEQQNNFVPPLPSETSIPPPPPTLPPSTTEHQTDSQSPVDKESDNPSPDSTSLAELESQKLQLMAALEENDSGNEVRTSSPTEDEDSVGNPMSTPKQGRVRESNMGTPVFNISGYLDLPASDSFSKDICDVINFENLPDSTGKYVQMNELIKKIRHTKSLLEND